MTDSLTENAIRLMGEHTWDFFMLVYRDTDEMAHFFWRQMDATHPAHDPEIDAPYKDAILNYYRRVDAAIGDLIAAAGPETTVIIMSDHGTGPLYRDVSLNEWLRKHGYLATKNDQVEQSGYRGRLASIGITRENVSTTLRNLRLGRVERWIKDLLGDKIEVLPRSDRTEFPQAVDWPKTRAYSFGYHGQILINLKGREPEGTVEPGAEYQKLRAEISTALSQLKDPLDNLPVVDEVLLKEDVFHGGALKHAPDMMIIMRELSYITRQGFEFGEQGGQIFTAPHAHQSGSHRMDGLLIMAGPDIAPGNKKREPAHLIDLAPTILHLLECPVPEEMDGQVLQDWLVSNREIIFDQQFSQSADIEQPEKTLNEEEEQEMIERLKKLGYLE
jgi:predicted AlkP superfamily phosphohydrolase/phosphomutase